MLRPSAIRASDPIRRRRHTYRRTIFGNILDEAMRVKIGSRLTDKGEICAKAVHTSMLMGAPKA
jgi:hypothetical protein